MKIRVNKKYSSYILIGLGAFLIGLAVNMRDNVHFSTNTTYAECSVCFTPGNPCTQKIVDRIDNAKKEILVQSYSFTSPEISQALQRAQERNIVIKAIFDSSQENAITVYSLAKAGIEVFIDKVAGIAHNKVMIIDEEIVLTGSFNFTKAAQTRNVENSVCLRSKNIAKQYKQHWQERYEKSVPYDINSINDIEDLKPANRNKSNQKHNRKAKQHA